MMLEWRYAKCHYSQWRYAECRYAECCFGYVLHGQISRHLLRVHFGSIDTVWKQAAQLFLQP
jgi:hypothetical protein